MTLPSQNLATLHNQSSSGSSTRVFNRESMTLAASFPFYLAFLFPLLATRTDELAIVSDNRAPTNYCTENAAKSRQLTSNDE